MYNVQCIHVPFLEVHGLVARTRWPLAIAILLLLAPLSIAPHSEADPRPRVRPGRVWVRLRDGGPPGLQQRARSLPVGQLEALVPQIHGAVLRVPPGQEIAAARRLAADPGVVYAVPIPPVHALDDPDDSGYASQWALPKIGAPSAWDVTTGSDQMVMAIVDSGIDLDHPDLESRLWTNPGEIPGNGEDDDGNGCQDDVHGCNFVPTPELPEGDPSDDYGHGTHVAGIAGAATNNGVGTAGMSWAGSMMAVKVLDSSGSGYMDDVAQGIVYAVDNGARIVNLSLGGPSPFAPLQEALAYARQGGALVVAAAGNHSAPGDPTHVFYPAAYPEAMAVAATDSLDRQASFSNHGPQISVAAPGVWVYSTCLGDNYCYMSGTSMATPHVAGLAALVWSRHPEYSPALVQATIEMTAADVNASQYPGWDPYLGHGRIDAAAAVRLDLSSVYLPYVSKGP